MQNAELVHVWTLPALDTSFSSSAPFPEDSQWPFQVLISDSSYPVQQVLGLKGNETLVLYLQKRQGFWLR